MADDNGQSGEAARDLGRSARVRSKKQKLAKTARQQTEKRVRWPDRAERVIRFIELLTIPSGIGQGERFVLRPWQKRFIRDIYEPHDAETGQRLVRRAILSVARKNGKTAIIAALVLAHLYGPEAIENGEIYSAANDREQASIVYRVAAQMVRANAELSEALRCIDSTKSIACYANGSFYRALSAESGTKHGLNPTFVCYDELSQAKSRTLYDVLDTSFGARAEPLFVVISTQSNDPEHIMSRLVDDGLNSHDPRIVCHLYAVPEECPNIFDAQVWKQANPALGDFRSLNDFRAIADKAKRMPAEEPKFRNLYLNQRVSPVSSLIARAEWMACVGPVAFSPGEDVYLGLDLSSVADLTALIMGSAGEKTKVASYFWKPEQHLREHGNRDFGSGNDRYTQWCKTGHLLASPGKTINPVVVAQKVVELCQTYNVLGLAYDRTFMGDIMRVFDTLDFPVWEDKGTETQPGPTTGFGLRMVRWGQGYIGMAPAVNALEREVMDRTLVHSSNPVMNWNMRNAVASMDPAGNRKIDKEQARFRIDGAVALAMMCGLKSRDRKAVIDIAAMIG